MAVILDIDKVCNLSRIPCSISGNPLKKASELILNNNFDVRLSYEYLKDYYKSLNYSTLNDLFSTDIEKLKQFKYHDIFLPWVHTSPVRKLRDDAFITSLEDDLVLKKTIKLKNLLVSIKSNGYNPSEHLDRKQGQITGYFFKKMDKEKFYVVSGNHRVAVLAALGYKNIPVIFENISFFKTRDLINFGWQQMPTEFSTLNVREWASVKSNFLSEEEALKILNVYMG